MTSATQVKHLEFLDLTLSLQQRAEASGQRRMLTLSGDPTWCRQHAQLALRHLPPGRALWVGDTCIDGVTTLPAAKARTQLGTECTTLVFDAHAGFDPDAFGAVTGTLKGGGLLLLLTPPFETWPDNTDPALARIAVYPYRPEQLTGRFLQRLIRVLQHDPDLIQVDQDRGTIGPCRPLATADTCVKAGATELGDRDCLSRDQLQAVKAVLQVAEGQPQRPLVLVADRGRGKSAALGIAAARLLRSKPRHILVTAPSALAAAALFAHAAKLLPAAKQKKLRLVDSDRRLEFIAPDELCRHKPKADLLLVDEAAAIPAPLLQHLLTHYPRIVFTTTIHGYEGTGRGFAVRFRQVLDRDAPQWRQLRIDTPIRWRAGDPVEAFSFRALMLNAEPAAAVAEIRPADYRIEQLDRDTLGKDEARLSQLFGLLVLAHYRTRPNDLRQLLDGPRLAVWTLQQTDQVLATALIAAEGGFSPQLARQIWAGRRRPRGHLLAQSLAAHLGLEAAPCQQIARIMRIAVHPELQRQGLGSRLLHAIVQQASTDGFDQVGASFGATQGLLSFWTQAGFSPVRLGDSRDASSGTHSAMMLRPLSDSGRELFDLARRRFVSQFAHTLADPHYELEPALATMLLRDDQPPREAPLDEQDWWDLLAFAYGLRSYETVSLAAWKLARLELAEPGPGKRLTAAARDLVRGKVLLRKPWQQITLEQDFSGRNEALSGLREAMRQLVDRYGAPWVRQVAKDLQQPMRR